MGKKYKRKNRRTQRYETDKGKNRVKDNTKSFSTEFWQFSVFVFYHNSLAQSHIAVCYSGDPQQLLTIPKRTEGDYHETNITSMLQQQFFRMLIISSFTNMNVQLKHKPSL